MAEVVLDRGDVWFPRVVRDGDELRLTLPAGADGNHDPREFSLPVGPEHLEVLRADLARHLLLYAVLVPLCDAAGTQGSLDQAAAAALLDAVLLAPRAQVDRLLATARVDRILLARHGADLTLMERGELLASLHDATEASDPQRGQTYLADRQRAERGVVLGPLDEAVLRFTGHYLHASVRPARHPDAVDPGLLPEVLRVVATAELASGRRDRTALSDAVDAALRAEFPDLVGDARRSVAALVRTEAAQRDRDGCVGGHA